MSGRINQLFPCVADELTDDYSFINSCQSSDALSVYINEDDNGEESYSGFCFSCSQHFNQNLLAKTSIGAELGLSDSGEIKERKQFQVKEKPDPITDSQRKQLITQVGYKANGYRGIDDEFVKFYGCLTQLKADGSVYARFYPETQGRKVMGYTCRIHPKNFNVPRLGQCGIANDLYGQIKWRKGGGKFCLVVGGQEDCHAALQMFTEYNRSRGQSDYEPFPIVSPLTGEGSAYKQLAEQYDWLDTFDNIVLALDSDKAGKEAIQKCCEVLPSDKVQIVTWSGKDPNDMLERGKGKQFIRDFYNMKPFIPDSVKSSKDADMEMEIELARPKIPLPPFMSKLQNLMAGGIPLGYIVNLGAMTGGGKTTLANEMIYYWIFNSPYKVGILSLELNAGQYQTTMLSRHIGKKIHLIEDPKEALEFVQQEWVVQKRTELREHDNGEARYVLLDGREGTLTEVKKQIEKLVRKYECKFIIIDPVNDLFEGVGLDEQTGFIKYLKNLISEGISVLNICHITKGKTQTDSNGNRILRQLTEDDFAGVSNIVKSGGCNILINRDKLAEDDIERNTTIVEVPKCRWTGRSGFAGKWYYDNDTHTIYDYEDYFKDKPPTVENNNQNNAVDNPSDKSDDTPPFEITGESY